MSCDVKENDMICYPLIGKAHILKFYLDKSSTQVDVNHEGVGFYVFSKGWEGSYAGK
jgi:hypothetical protein